MMGHVLSLKQKNGPEVSESRGHDEDDDAKDDSQLADGIGDGQYAGPDDCFDDSGDCEEEI
jgi:hypothetical protein